MKTNLKQVTTKGGTSFPVYYAPKNNRQGWQVENVTFAYLLAQILNERGAVTKIERSSGKWHVLTNIKAEETQPQEQQQPQGGSAVLRQFKELKAKHPDALLLFRCGDFYETYEQDAREAADILGIILTKSSKSGIAMAGFPFHALDTYLPKLIRAGKRVAICDQLEMPKKTKKTAKPAEDERQNLMPLLYKWLELKKEHPEDITLLQDNEEYITFGQQAEDTADILKLKMIKAKGCSYTAFPAEKINDYMHIFIKAGKTIALCNNPL